MSSNQRNLGFTLVELSIVLVMIGLLVGGVVAARVMIANADLRSGVAQLESYNQAALTFKSKYACLPGDCRNSEQLGASYNNNYCDDGNGDNELNDGCNGGGRVNNMKTTISNEVYNFWYGLTNLKLIPGSYPGGMGPFNSISTNNTHWGIASPLTKFAAVPRSTETMRVWVWNYQGWHYWAFTGGGFSQWGL
ncbi:MAG: prepilin-type N-terminal cleavage/methylation domain-containing protein [Alphaproteobacteria bacterium]|nr:prepilin-type N-terminal cleavage/methylation domain-containing protein [Alphaproteobacteria bacterium]